MPLKVSIAIFKPKSDYTYSKIINDIYISKRNQIGRKIYLQEITKAALK